MLNIFAITWQVLFISKRLGLEFVLTKPLKPFTNILTTWWRILDCTSTKTMHIGSPEHSLIYYLCIKQNWKY